jgi:putative transposase
MNQTHRKLCKRFDDRWDAHYLTFSCFGRQPFFKSRNAPLWFLENLARVRRTGLFELWGYVIMPEHVHLLILPAENVSISEILRQVKQPVSQRVVRWVRRNAPSFLPRMKEPWAGTKGKCHFWQQGGGYDRNLRSTHDVHEKLNYIHNNPVRRGLVDDPRKWPWSSCKGWDDGTDDPVPIDRQNFPILRV